MPPSTRTQDGSYLYIEFITYIANDKNGVVMIIDENGTIAVHNMKNTKQLLELVQIERSRKDKQE